MSVGRLYIFAKNEFSILKLMRVDISKTSYELPRRVKRIILLGCDTFTFSLAIYLAFAFRFSTVYPTAIFDYSPIIFLLFPFQRALIPNRMADSLGKSMEVTGYEPWTSQ